MGHVPRRRHRPPHAGRRRLMARPRAGGVGRRQVGDRARGSISRNPDTSRARRRWGFAPGPCRPSSGRRGADPSRPGRRTRDRGPGALRAGTRLHRSRERTASPRPSRLARPVVLGPALRLRRCRSRTRQLHHRALRARNAARTARRASRLVRGRGDRSWSVAEEEHRTEFNTRVYGDDLGRMLDSLGFDGSGVAGGKTNISLDGSWTGAPARLRAGAADRRHAFPVHRRAPDPALEPRRDRTRVRAAHHHVAAAPPHPRFQRCLQGRFQIRPDRRQLRDRERQRPYERSVHGERQPHGSRWQDAPGS